MRAKSSRATPREDEDFLRFISYEGLRLSSRRLSIACHKLAILATCRGGARTSAEQCQWRKGVLVLRHSHATGLSSSLRLAVAVAHSGSYTVFPEQDVFAVIVSV